MSSHERFRRDRVCQRNSGADRAAGPPHSFIEKSVLHADNKTGVGSILSVEEWWNQVPFVFQKMTP